MDELKQKYRRTLAIRIVECMILFFQIVVLIGLCVLGIHKPFEAKWGPDDILAKCSNSMVQEVIYQGEKYVSAINAPSGGNLFYNQFERLFPGAYEVEIVYGVNEDSQFGQHKSLGECGVQLPDQEDRIINSPTHFSAMNEMNGVNRTKSYFWVKLGRPVHGLELRLDYWGNELCVHSIVVRERGSYHVLQILSWLVIMGILDLGYYYFVYRWKEKRQNKFGMLAGIIVILVLANLSNSFRGCMVMDDSWYHLERIASLAEGLRDGQFPVRFGQNVNDGYGYISSLMYGELFLYIPGILVASGCTLQTSYAIYVFLINLLTIIIAFVVFRDIFKNPWISLVGTFIYTLAPYRHTDIYQRVAVGEYTAWTFLPLLVLGFYRIYVSQEKNQWKRVLPLVLGASGMVQSHVLTCEMSMLFIVLFMLLNIKQTIKWQNIKTFLIAMGSTFLLNAWFIIPFLHTILQIELNVFAKQHVVMTDHFLKIYELFRVNPAIRMVPGFFVWVLLSVAVFYLVYLLLKKEKLGNGGRMILVTAVFTLFSIFLCIRCFPYAELIKIPGIGKMIESIQFPWRFLEFAMLFVSILACSLFSEMNQRGWKISIILLAVTCLVLILAEWLPRSKSFVGNEQVYSTCEIPYLHIGNGEYLPSCAGEYKIVGELDGKIKEPEECQVLEVEKQGLVYRLEIDNKTNMEQILQLPLFDYPNYQVRAENGQKVVISKESNGYVRLVVPAGFDGTVKLWYQIPVVWRICEVLSFLSLVGALLGSVYGIRKRNGLISRH